MDTPVKPLPESALGTVIAGIAMEAGLCRPSEVVDALCLQEELRTYGIAPERLVRILLDRGSISPDGVAKLLSTAEATVRTLHLPGFRDLLLARRDPTTLVFWGREESGRRSVVVRILRLTLSESREHADRFVIARRTLERLDATGVVPVVGLGDTEGIPYVALERVPGPDLANLLAESGAVSERLALEILRDAASALGQAHSLGVVHGAISPGALSIPRIGAARISEFPLFDRPPQSCDELAPYTAPEQVRASERPDVKGDIYSLGATAYHAMTGRPPFLGRVEEIRRQRQRRAAPDPRVLAPSLTTAASDLVLGMLESDPARRPASMADVVAVAERCLTAPRTEGPGLVRNDARFDRLLGRRPLRRSR